MHQSPGTQPLTTADEDRAVLPWKYNPSAWSQRVPVCLLAFIATLIASHLAAFQWGLIDYVWDPVFGNQSEKVIGSDVAKTMDAWIGVPDAALGAIAYLGDAIFGLAGSTRRWQDRPWIVILFGIDVIPLGVVSVILVLIQTFVLGQWCFLCLVTATISIALIYLAYDEVCSSLLYLGKVWQASHSKRDVWTTLCGFPTPTGIRVGQEMLQSNEMTSTKGA
ncbi:vitamin K epoxide reductase family protein [Blastopirellula marina]|uniref:Vitamin K epoxide reductase n=1 Tax=Blastopirellula marina TaxID=124 RepID=A0A2S8G9I6_9BACT|nr:vitamin K epoxide reductase family protein [Blastopirellula marina]PQO41125.1 vitamin K epoxide reductase [Blastopirellula marina]PTL46001.1 vitamin K epoxide reductase [Blastopirellula marina]